MSDNATLEDFGLNLDHENIFAQGDFLSTWIEAENNAVFCQSFQNFWGDSISCQENAVGFDMSSSTFLSQSTLPQALIEDLSVTQEHEAPWNNLGDGIEDLWDTSLFAEELLDRTQSSTFAAFEGLFPTTLPSPPFPLRDHDYSLSPSLLPIQDSARPKIPGKSSMTTTKFHRREMFQGEKMLMTSTIANRPKPRLKKPGNHNERERYRRSRLKLELERVRELLPSHNKSKRPATKTILDSAANYCLFLTARLKSLMRMRNQEKTRRENFCTQIAKASLYRN